VFKSHTITRRDFTKVVLGAIGGVMGAVIGIPAIGYLISPATKTQQSESWISLGPLENYQAGVPTLFSFTRSKINGWEKTVNSHGVYVIKQNDAKVLVLSNKCTHLSCRVTWKEENQSYVCPCHDAHFAKEGKVISGPPPEPLSSFETKIEEGNLYFYFVEA
jgi:menaquinol-cytochrome c reductase iron-sulfur subunit